MNFYYETPRLILRLAQPEEAPAVLNFYSQDKELFERFEGEHIPLFYTVEFHQENLSQELNLAYKMSHIRFYVYLRSNPSQIIGTICFHNIQPVLYSSCEVGYKFASAYHHQGYASEALEKAIDAIFSDGGIHRIMAWVAPDNEASLKLLRSLGFQLEGINKDRAFLNGKWQDHLQFSLISPIR